MRANISCGQKPRDRWVLVTRPDHASDTTPLQRRIGIYAQTIISLYSDISEQLRLAERARPDVLDGYSMWMHSLAKEALDRDIETIRPRIMFGSAEFIDSASVESWKRSLTPPSMTSSAAPR